MDELDALIDHAPKRGGAVVICGEAGIGKSVLLEHARQRASDLGFQTLVTVGVESEAELAFAGLHQLLRPVIEHVELLPLPQRERSRRGVRCQRRPRARPVSGGARGPSTCLWRGRGEAGSTDR